MDVVTYPSSTVQAIWAPAIEMLSVMRSQVDRRRFCTTGHVPSLLVEPRCWPSAAADSELPPCLGGQGTGVAGPEPESGTVGIIGIDQRWEEEALGVCIPTVV